MATIWARTNGAWNASIWDYFNENTQQVEAYSFAEPQIGDYVYLNGKTVTVDATQTNIINIGNGTISREINPNTSLGGGFIDILNNVNLHPLFYVIANFIGESTGTLGTILRHGIVNNTTHYYVPVDITGNVAYCAISSNIQGVYIRILGNVNNVSFTEGSVTSGTSYVYINGAVKDINYNNPASRIGYVSITGSLKQGSNILSASSTSNPPLYVNGNFTPYNNLKLPHNIQVNGTIDCSQNHNICPIDTGYYMITSSADGLSLIASTDYPPEDKVKAGTEYDWGRKVGTYQQPPESVVLNGYVYDNGDKVGSMSAQAQVGCVTKEDVREGVPLLGMGEVGTCAVPSPDDVREGVPVDDTIGTLIVQGGGDRLRIADFGYYTNAQSDTYIVDLTEQDKPKFAVAEERVLIEMFPDLDLDNIPEKYFDDLFVKYLKYRLIVEYYRTAGINSTFTPSEPTTEIVNYQNVRNEVWLNSANIYLRAWSKKYPESITKPQRILL